MLYRSRDMSGFTINTELFSKFAFYAAIVLIKVIFMWFPTGFYRFKNKIFINQEDAVLAGDSRLKPSVHPDVERVRRVHLNDLENVVPFILIGLLYVFTNPDITTAVWHFRLFVASRFLHTFVYLFAVPQPARVIAFMVGIFTTASMAYRVFSLSAY